ncbi:hypothetical protein LTR66_004031 [Elasticomyces elasticus]|nr:hypothetical protein LTR66_004031 [Elasticomyces elasticus]KAK5011817.1 hypothetical protein LTR28_012288 [Elasticomyces elasticus]
MDIATPPSLHSSTRKRKRCPLDSPEHLPRLPPSPRPTPPSQHHDTQRASLTQDEPLSFEAKSALTLADASALFACRQSPVSTPDNSYKYYDAEFGQKVCSAYERHMRTAELVQGLREHKYGPDIAVQYERGYTPEEAREEYEAKQEEGLRACREDMTDDDETVQPLAQTTPKANQAECTATYMGKESAVEYKSLKRRRLLDNSHRDHDRPRRQRKRRRKSNEKIQEIATKALARDISIEVLAN